jgi:5-deoxy-glucuronate isomerase
MSGDERWVLPLGAAKRDGFDVVVEASEDWRHTGLYVLTLAAGERREFAADGLEHVVVPLAGSVVVEHWAEERGASMSTAQPDTDATTGPSPRVIRLAGRPDVFAGPTDTAYLPRGTRFVLSSDAGARVAVPAARAARRESSPPARHLAAAEVPVELRGAGRCSREVRNFATPAVLEADSIIACEVLTPGGNWSSYPPHKHDEERAGVETELEEIYYFEVRSDRAAPAGAEPVGYQRVYGTGERPIDVLAEVRSGDVVLVPHGWHGPSMAAPGYDLYYLNVMAGPGPERAWLICDDPAHTWVRATWDDEAVDPRLPFGGSR